MNIKDAFRSMPRANRERIILSLIRRHGHTFDSANQAFQMALAMGVIVPVGDGQFMRRGDISAY